jgi:hypothetical protein
MKLPVAAAQKKLHLDGGLPKKAALAAVANLQ